MTTTNCSPEPAALQAADCTPQEAEALAAALRLLPVAGAPQYAALTAEMRAEWAATDSLKLTAARIAACFEGRQVGLALLRLEALPALQAAAVALMVAAELNREDAGEFEDVLCSEAKREWRAGQGVGR